MVDLAVAGERRLTSGEIKNLVEKLSVYTLMLIPSILHHLIWVKLSIILRR